MSRFCLKKNDGCDSECSGDCEEADGTVLLGYNGKWRLEYEEDSVWIVCGDIEYFWSLEEDEKYNINHLSVDKQDTLLCAFRLAVREEYMDCPAEYSWLMDKGVSIGGLFLGHFQLHGCTCRCAWPTNNAWHSELITESRRRAKMIGLVEAESELKEKLPMYKYLGDWGRFAMSYEDGLVYIDGIGIHIIYKFGNDISRLSYEVINALTEAVRLAVDAKLLDCPSEYMWMLDKNPWPVGSYNSRDYIWLGWNENKVYLLYPDDNSGHAIHRAKMLGFYKERLDPTQVKVTYSYSYYSPDGEKLEDAVELMRELYDFGYWWTTNDKTHTEQIEIWEKVRKFLLENEKKG
jgi:hypothetical protein